MTGQYLSLEVRLWGGPLDGALYECFEVPAMLEAVLDGESAKAVKKGQTGYGYWRWLDGSGNRRLVYEKISARSLGWKPDCE